MIDIAVFGGSFNPFHNAELAIARQVLEQLSPQKLIFIPNGSPPHKKAEDLLDKELRYKLLCLGTAGEPRFEVSRLEIDRPGISWSIDSLKVLKARLGKQYRLNFIIGEDNVIAFHKYKERRKFFKLARILIAPRSTANTTADESMLKAAWQKLLPEAEILPISCACSDISSTEIRSRIMQKQDFRGLVPEAIYNFIIKNGLYGASAPEGTEFEPAA